MIIHSKRLIFVHIQKTGGTSVSAVLGGNGNSPEKHFLACELRELYGPKTWDAYFKFAFVRNPWDRLVSWWSMINEQRKAYDNGSILNSFHAFVLSRATTFEEFLENCDEDICDNDGRKWIYRNQMDYLTDSSGRLIVDFVGRFDRLQKDFDIVAQKALGGPVLLPQTNRSLHNYYPEYYSAAMAEKVRVRFKRDIDTFGFVFGR